MSQNNFEVFGWEEYQQLPEESTRERVIFYSPGIDWAISKSLDDKSKITYLEANQIDREAYIFVSVLENVEEKQKDEKQLGSFYINFVNLDLGEVISENPSETAIAKAADFMLGWGIYGVEGHKYHRSTLSNIFTFSDLNDYQQDFKQCFLYFGVQGDYLLANQFQEKLKESIQLDLTHREKHKTGKLEREAKRGEGRHRAFWAEDGGALDIISKMNKHVNRCYQDFSIRRTDDGQHAEYGMGLIFPDLVARAYYQLASVIKSNEKKQLEFRTCELCAHVCKAHNENQRFCSTNDKNCKRQAAAQRAYQKQMQDPEKKAKKRKQSQDSQRKMRQKKRD